MVWQRLLSQFRKGPAVPATVGAGRLDFDDWPDVVYAIGDVHGRLDLLRQAEARIVEDGQAFSGDRRIVMLGDYIDRGPQSAAVLDHLVAQPPQGFRRHCILGNHEVMMLGFFAGGGRFDWLSNGGSETLTSYGIPQERIDYARRSHRRVNHLLHSYIPEEHIAFLEGLNRAIGFPGCDLMHFPPDLSGGKNMSHEQRVAEDFGLRIMPRDAAARVVHGHHVVESVSLDGPCVNIDTGAYLTGRLTAVRLRRDEDIVLV